MAHAADDPPPAEGAPAARAGAPELEPGIAHEEPAPPVAPQPIAGLLGLAVTIAGFALLGIVLGGPQTALETVGPLATFCLTVLAVSALWWEGWPANRVGQPAQGLVNLTIILVGGLLLTALGQAIVGRLDLDGMFSTPGPESTTFPTWPWTMPLGILTFVATLQITFVNGRWPFARLGGRLAGIAVLLTSWATALVVYFLVVNWDIVPPPARDALGLGNPGGPVLGLTLLGWLAIVTAFQVMFYIGLSGWPTRGLRNEGPRLIAANVLTIGGGWLTWLLLARGFDWSAPTISAIGASIAAAAVINQILFDNWPSATLRPTGSQVGAAASQIGVIAILLFYGLRGLGNALETWDRDPVELWVTVSCLNFIAATAIIHVAVFHRWPLSALTRDRP